MSTLQRKRTSSWTLEPRTHLNGVVLYVEVTGSAAEVGWVQIPVALIETNHPRFVESATRRLDQLATTLFQRWVVLPFKQARETSN